LRNYYIATFFLLISLISCHQLNLNIEEKDDSDSSEYSSEVTISDGDTGRISIKYGERNSLLLNTAEVQHPGYYKLSLTAASNGAENLSSGRIVLRVFNDEPFIGNSQYEVFNDRDDSGVYNYYFLSDGMEKNILIYHDDEYNTSLNVFDLSVNTYAYTIDDSFKHGDIIEKSLSPGDVINLSVDSWGEVSYLYSMKNIVIDQDYALLVDWDKSNSILQFTDYIGTYIHPTDSRFKVEYQYRETLEEVTAYIFKVTTNDGISGMIDDMVSLYMSECFTGDSIKISLKETSVPVFSADSYEPDQGPLAPTLDIIDTDNKTSAPHTISDSDEDWLQWQPWGAGDYKISLQLEGAWFVEGATEGLSYRVNLTLINQNGAEVESQGTCRITEPPTDPVVSPDLILFTVESDPVDPMFIQVSTYDEIQYRIIVEKL
jgi:hypothetical protein